MALPSTIHRFQIQLADTGRGVYEDLELRVARHPSETAPFLLTRVFAYCLAFEPGIEFGSGLSTPDDPALWVKDLTGRVTRWIEVGLPAPERLHKASKGVGNVAVFPHKRPEQWLAQCEGTHIHRASEIRLVLLEPAFLDALGKKLERNVRLDVSVHDGHMFVTCDGTVSSTSVVERALSG